VRGEGGVFLAKRALPEQLPVLIQGNRHRANAECVDVARLGVGGGGGPADAVRRDVALKDVELVFPDRLAGVGIQAHDAFLEIGAASGRVLHVDAIAQDDRRRAAAVRHAPQKVLAVQRPLLGQSGFLRHAVTIRAAHLGPVAERDLAKSLRRHQQTRRRHKRRRHDRFL